MPSSASSWWNATKNCNGGPPSVRDVGSGGTLVACAGGLITSRPAIGEVSGILESSQTGRVGGSFRGEWAAGSHKKVLNRTDDRDDHPCRAPRRKSKVLRSSPRRRSRDAAPRRVARAATGAGVATRVGAGGHVGHGHRPWREDVRWAAQRGRSAHGAHATALAGTVLQLQRLRGRGSGHDPGPAEPGLPGDRRARGAPTCPSSWTSWPHRLPIGSSPSIKRPSSRSDIRSSRCCTCRGTRRRRVHGASANVIRTMFETDSIPPDWVGRLNLMDEVWVPTHFNAETFANAGVTVPIHVVPGGVDATLFRPALRPLRIPGTRGTVFLSIFEWAFRKGWDVLLSAWAEAFGPEDDVSLVLRTTPVAGAGGSPAPTTAHRRPSRVARQGTRRGGADRAAGASAEPGRSAPALCGG